MSRYCSNCTRPDVIKGPDPHGFECDGPVWAIEGGSHVVDMRHLVQYTEPDEAHPSGSITCGREYTPGLRISGQTWVELDALSRYDEIRNLFYESDDHISTASPIIDTSVRGTGRSKLQIMLEKIDLGKDAIKQAIQHETQHHDRLSNFLNANPFPNPQRLTPEIFTTLEQHVASKVGTHRLHEATMGGVNAQLQGEIDTMSTAIASLNDAHGRAELRTVFMTSLLDGVVSNELEKSVNASNAAAGFAHLGASLLKDAYHTLTTVEI